ncbi:MAG: NOB1 family endonuclease [Candidatus Bathyarchaeia archaeon]
MLKRSEKREVLVLDTSAFIAGFEPLSVKASQYSVPEVRKELAANSLSRTRFNAAVENGLLKVKAPAAKYKKRIRASSKVAGDMRFLSEADEQVLALAMELKEKGYTPHIVTDDYAIQNVADQLGIEFTSLITFGIRYRFRWVLYCPACHQRYPADYSSACCNVCGTKLKRKPFRKTPINRMKQ